MITDGVDLALEGVADGKVDFIEGPDGEPIFDDTEEFRVTTLLSSRLGEYWGDPTGRRGSRLHTVKYDKTITGAQLEAYSLEALQKAVIEGYIRAIKTRAVRKGQGRYQIIVQWTAVRSGISTTRRYNLKT